MNGESCQTQLCIGLFLIWHEPDVLDNLRTDTLKSLTNQKRLMTEKNTQLQMFVNRVSTTTVSLLHEKQNQKTRFVIFFLLC